MEQHLEESGEALRRTGSRAKTGAKRFFDGFSDFALRDNVLEVAVGLIQYLPLYLPRVSIRWATIKDTGTNIASAFNSIVNSMVSDIILPPISLLPFLGKNLHERFSVLKSGPHYNESHGYNTIKQAQDDGAVVMTWGSFIDRVINFFVVVICLFFIARIYQWASDDTVIKKTVKCKYCRKRINVKAKRCINCTSWQDGREEKQGQEQSLI